MVLQLVQFLTSRIIIIRHAMAGLVVINNPLTISIRRNLRLFFAWYLSISFSRPNESRRFARSNESPVGCFRPCGSSVMPPLLSSHLFWVTVFSSTTLYSSLMRPTVFDCGDNTTIETSSSHNFVERNRLQKEAPFAAEIQTEDEAARWETGKTTK